MLHSFCTINFDDAQLTSCWLQPTSSPMSFQHSINLKFPNNHFTHEAYLSVNKMIDEENPQIRLRIHSLFTGCNKRLFQFFSCGNIARIQIGAFSAFQMTLPATLTMFEASFDTNTTQVAMQVSWTVLRSARLAQSAVFVTLVNKLVALGTMFVFAFGQLQPFQSNICEYSGRRASFGGPGIGPVSFILNSVVTHTKSIQTLFELRFHEIRRTKHNVDMLKLVG